MREPYNLRPWDIRKLTPRQICDAYFARPEEMDENEEHKPEAPRENDNTNYSGAQGVQGLGLEKYKCWAPTPREIELRKLGVDPSTDIDAVPRAQARERWYTAAFEINKRNGWVQESIKVIGRSVTRDDAEGLRDFCDAVWALNEANYQKLLKEKK